jgi:hypothetical protein
VQHKQNRIKDPAGGTNHAMSWEEKSGQRSTREQEKALAVE